MMANPLADTQVNQMGSTFEEVFETTTDAALAFDIVVNDRRKKTIGTRITMTGDRRDRARDICAGFDLA